jgi:hypothetical protein
MRRFLVLATVALAAAVAVPAAATAALPPVRHVFVVVLENTSYAESFGPTAKAPYFSRDLPAQGNLLTQYYGTTHFSLGNYLAMISGQPSNVLTQSDCLLFQDFLSAGIALQGAEVGQGCVYPKRVKTLADQLDARGLTWKGYMQDMANGPQPDTCRHPALNSVDDTQSAEVGDQYATRHNPFMYFHSIIDDQARCSAHVVDLAELERDLQSVDTTPSFSFITPNLCDDGHDEPTCVDGRPGGLVAADAFLQRELPKILASPAFKEDGLLLVTFDEAEASGDLKDSSACCNQPAGPNTPSPGGTNPGPGGGRIGAVALSRWITPGSTSTVPYNHYSFLRSMEDLLGIGEHLGYANQLGLASFGDDVFTNPAGTTQLPLAGMSPPVQARPPRRRCASTEIRGRKVRTGDLVRSIVVSDPIGGRRNVRLAAAHAARVSVTATVRGLTTRIATNRRVRACKTYSYALPHGAKNTGRLHVVARVPSGAERRTARYR